MNGRVDMQLERTQTGWLSIRARFLVIAVIVLAVVGITIPLMAKSGTTGQPAQPASGVQAPPPVLAMMSFAGYVGQREASDSRSAAPTAIQRYGARPPTGPGAWSPRRVTSRRSRFQ